MAVIKKFRIKSFKNTKPLVSLKNISLSFGNRKILDNVNFNINQGEILGMLGPNGVGKTTLIKMLLREVQPDFGEIKLGSNLIIAKFDQMREQLNLENSLLQNLTDVPNIQTTGTAGQIIVRGKPKHVAGYLKDFLFSEARN